MTALVVNYPGRWSDFTMSADPEAVRTMVESIACAVRFARGSDHGSEKTPLVLTGFSLGAGAASHVALAGEDFARLWDEYHEAGGPPQQLECVVSGASTRVDGFVGFVGTYDAFVGYDGKWGRDFMLEREPGLREVLYGAVGTDPGLPVRLFHGDSDTLIPVENSAGFEAVLADAGYDVELTEFSGGHYVPSELPVEAVLDLVAP